MLCLLREKANRRDGRKLEDLYPATGELRREAYPVHMEFFREGRLADGRARRERTVMAANRIGKTLGIGGYETTLHLTGSYPEWWPGYRFERPIAAWAASETRYTTRDILQEKLLGKPGQFGTGLIPRERIIDWSMKPGVPDAVEEVKIRHETGISLLGFRSYDQGREAFQGTERDVMWNDEEPPLVVYVEGLTRTMTTGGMVINTFTPLKGMSDTVMHIIGERPLERRMFNGEHLVLMASWDDVPHLTVSAKAELHAAFPAWQHDARERGIPQLGSGAIYPVAESVFVVDPFPIPPHWYRGYGMDVGWKCTAGVWGAKDPDAKDGDVLYLYDEYAAGELEPSEHAKAFILRGDYCGAIDPAARGRGQSDGAVLLTMYLDSGLSLVKANNAVESGIYGVLEGLKNGRIKVFRSMIGWLGEYRLYRRDEKGRVVKLNDHRMDATRYLVQTWPSVATLPGGGGKLSALGARQWA